MYSEKKLNTNKKIFFNRFFDKNRLKKLINWSLLVFGEKKTIDLVESLKKIGYFYATKAGISLSIDDLKIPKIKKQLLFETESKLKYINQDIEKGYLTSIEYFSNVIDTWNVTNERLKKEVIENLKKKDILNPVYMMAFSGARGNISQVRQLVGMRGLMSDPTGQIIDFPIKNNFREGLTLTEYIISCYGARKGVVDTALRTATSGYLTRRLVDVAQHVIVRLYDCGTKKGIYLVELKKEEKTVLNLINRLIGRVLVQDVYELNNKKNKLASKNQEISLDLAKNLIQNKQHILIRSPLTCQDKNYVCQLCYGWNLSTCRLVSIGESVGIIAAQSIGEPGTQLTMRTFHTGGVFSGQLLEQIKAPFSGFINFNQSIPGQLVRTTHGQIAFLTKQNSFFYLITNKKNNKKVTKILKLPSYTLLFVKKNQKVKKNQILAESAKFLTNLTQNNQAYQTLYSQLSGEVRFIKKKGIFNFQFYSVSSNSQAFWIISAQKQSILKKINLFIQLGDFVNINSFIYFYYKTVIHNQIVFNTICLVSSVKKITNFNVIKQNIKFIYFYQLKKFAKQFIFLIDKNKNLKNNNSFFFHFYFQCFLINFLKYRYFLLNFFILFGLKKKYFNKKKINNFFFIKIQANLIKLNQLIQLNKKIKKKFFFLKKNLNMKSITFNSFCFYRFYLQLNNIYFFFKKIQQINELTILITTLYKLKFFLKKTTQNTFKYFLNEKKFIKNKIKKYKKNLYLKKKPHQFFKKNLIVKCIFNLSNFIPFKIFLNFLFKKTKFNTKKIKFLLINKNFIFLNRQNISGLNNFKKKFQIKNFFLKQLILKKNFYFYNLKNYCRQNLNFQFNLIEKINYLKKNYYFYLNNEIFSNRLIKKSNKCLFFSFETYFKNYDFQIIFYLLNTNLFNVNKIKKNLNNIYELNFFLTKNIIQSYLLIYLKNKKKNIFTKLLQPKKYNLFIWFLFFIEFLKYINFLKHIPKIIQITKNIKIKEIKKYKIFKTLYFFAIFNSYNKKFFIDKYDLFLNNITMNLNLLSQLKSKILISYLTFLSNNIKKDGLNTLLFNYNKYLFRKNFDFFYFKPSANIKEFNISTWNLNQNIKNSILVKKYNLFYNFKLNQKILINKPFKFNVICITKILMKFNLFFLIKKNKNYWFNNSYQIKFNNILKNKILLNSYFVLNNFEISKKLYLKFLKKIKIYLSFFKFSLIINKFIQLIKNFKLKKINEKDLILKSYLKNKKFFFIKIFNIKKSYSFFKQKFETKYDYNFKNQKMQNLIKLNLNVLKNLKHLNKILICLFSDFFLKKNTLNLFIKFKDKTIKLKEKQLSLLIFQNVTINHKIFLKYYSIKIEFIYFLYDLLKNSNTWIFIITQLTNTFFIHNKIIAIGYYKINDILFENYFLFTKIRPINFKKILFFNIIDDQWKFYIINLKYLNEFKYFKFIFLKIIKKRFICYNFIFFDNYLNYLFLIKINSNLLKLYCYFYFELILIKKIVYSVKTYFDIVPYKKNNLNLLILNRKKKFQILNKYYRLLFLKITNLPKNVQIFNQNLKYKKSKLFIKKKKKLILNFVITSYNVIFNTVKRYKPKLIIQKILFNLQFKKEKINKILICYNLNKVMTKKCIKNLIINIFLINKIKFIIKKLHFKELNNNINNFKIIQLKNIYLLKLKKNFYLKNQSLILTFLNLKKHQKIINKFKLILNKFNIKLVLINNKKISYHKLIPILSPNCLKNINFLFKNFLLTPKIDVLLKNTDDTSIQLNYQIKQFIQFIYLFYKNNNFYFFLIAIFNLRNKIYYLNKDIQHILIQNILKKNFINKKIFLFIIRSNFFGNTKQFKKGFSKYKGDILKIVIPNKSFTAFHLIKYKKKNLIQIYYLTNKDIKTYRLYKNAYNLLKKSLGSFITYGTEIISNLAIFESGQLLLINKNKIIIRKAKRFSLSSGGICNLKNFSFVHINSPLLTLTYKNLKTEDIVQGIPKIDQIFEARENVLEQSSLNNLMKLNFIYFKKIYNKEIAVRRSIEYIQQYIVNAIQNVYQSQGVNISDKHIEIIVKQMTSKVKITKSGNTNLLRGDIVYLNWIEQINNSLVGQKAQYEPLVLGISKSSLEIEGFISAASFQETVKILSRAAILQKQDFLRGLKENLILGQLLPTGTGFEFPIIFFKKSIPFFKKK